MINISFRLTRKEYLFLYFKNLFKSRLLWGVLAFIFFLLFLPDLPKVFHQEFREGLIFLLISLIVASLLYSIVTGVIMLFFIFLITLWRILKSQKDFQAVISYEFSPTKVLVQTQYGKSEYKWDLFKSITEDKNYFYFKTINNFSPMIYIPKRAFKNGVDLEKFKTLAQEKKLLQSKN